MASSCIDEIFLNPSNDDSYDEGTLPTDQLISISESLSKASQDEITLVTTARLVPLLAKKLNSTSSVINSICFQCLRYLSTHWRAIRLMLQNKIDILISRSLCKGPEAITEREQSLKLARTWVSRSSQSKETLFPTEIVRTIVSMADHPEDKLRYLALETLCEIALSNISLVSLCGGIRTLCHSLLWAPPDMAECIAMSLMLLLDAPSTRQYFKPGLDLEMFLSIFSAPPFASKDFPAQLRASCRALNCILRHWAGIFLFCQFDMRPFISIISALRLPNEEVKLAVLKVIRDLLHIDNETSIATDLRSIMDHSNHFKALLFILFVDAGLFEVMAEMICSSSSLLSQSAITFARELLELSRILLPNSMAIQLQSLPELFFLSLQFHGDECMRQKALMAMTEIDQATEKREMTHTLRRASMLSLKTTLLSNRSRSSLSGSIQSMSGSLSVRTKSHQKWDWGAIHEFLHEIVHDNEKIKDVLNKTHFFKKLANFLSPVQFLSFSDSLEKIESSARIVIKCLLQIDEGLQFLSKHQLLSNIHDFFLVSFITPDGPNKALSNSFREKLPKLKIYFSILGLLTASERGLQLLEDFRFFSIFYSLLELEDQLETQKMLLLNFDYSSEGYTRVWLTTALTSSSNDLRFFATSHLKSILEKNNYTQCEWIIQLLKQQLYDTELNVLRLALELLDEACHFKACKNVLADSSLSLLHLGASGRSLLYHVASTSVGFQSMLSTQQLENELKLWFDSECEMYVMRQELLLFQVNFPRTNLPFKSLKKILEREMLKNNRSKSPEGCSWLEKTGHLHEFCQNVLNWNFSESKLLSVKAALWAIGHIGASSSGFELLESEGIIPYLFQLFHSCPIFSVSGTIFYILRLLCFTDPGMDLVNSYEWACHTESEKRFCFPLNSIEITPWKQKRFDILKRQVSVYIRDENPLHEEVLLHISNLGNQVQAHASMKSLRRILKKNQEVFTEMDLVSKVHTMLSELPFIWSARHFIYNLFTINDICMFLKPSKSKALYRPNTGIEDAFKTKVKASVNKEVLTSDIKLKMHDKKDLEVQKVIYGFKLRESTQ